MEVRRVSLTPAILWPVWGAAQSLVVSSGDLWVLLSLHHVLVGLPPVRSSMVRLGGMAHSSARLSSIWFTACRPWFWVAGGVGSSMSVGFCASGLCLSKRENDDLYGCSGFMFLGALGFMVQS